MRRPQRGKSFRHELLVETSLLGPRSRGAQWLKVVELELDRTLECLLGPDAPLEQLLETARCRVADSWPPPSSNEPLSIWVRRIASEVALEHMQGGAPPEYSGHRAKPRPGGVREVLSHLYARLRAMQAHDRLAFALQELNGSSVSEAAAVLRMSPATFVQCVSRVRRQLAFAARRDRLLLRYLCIAPRLQLLMGRVSVPAQLAAE
jgi:DNA-directed RNA polymerase specialized sigma24 family protein